MKIRRPVFLIAFIFLIPFLSIAQDKKEKEKTIVIDTGLSFTRYTTLPLRNQPFQLIDKTIDEIKEHLGLPIYNRFDSIIKFDDLPDMAKEKIAEREIERLKKDYDIEDRELFDKIKEGAVTQSNAREIKHLIKETFSLVALKKICGETEI